MSNNNNNNTKIARQLTEPKHMRNSDGIPHDLIANNLGSLPNDQFPVTVFVEWKSGTTQDATIERWIGQLSRNAADGQHFLTFASNQTENIEKYFDADDDGVPADCVVAIPHANTIYFEIKLNRKVASELSLNASVVRNNNSTTTNNNSNSNNNNNNNNSSSSQQNNNGGNNSNNNNNNSSRAALLSSAPTNNNFQRSSSNNNNNNNYNDDEHLNDSGNDDSDDGIDEAFEKRPNTVSDNIMMRTPPSRWQVELQGFTDEEKHHIKKEYRRLAWNLRDDWHTRSDLKALVSNWNLFFEFLYIDGIERSSRRNKIIANMQDTETAILLRLAARDKRNVIDYQGLAQADVLESSNPTIRHVASFITRRPAGAVRTGSQARKRPPRSSSGKFGPGKDICYKCKDPRPTAAYSTCKTHNKKLSGNAKAAPQQ